MSDCMIGTGSMTDPYLPLKMEIGKGKEMEQISCVMEADNTAVMANEFLSFSGAVLILAVL